MALFSKSSKKGRKIVFLLSVLFLIIVIVFSFVFIFPYLGQTIGKKTSLPPTINSHTK